MDLPGLKQAGLVMPAETHEHTRTFMAWPPADSVWKDATADVRRDVAGIARAIAGFEPLVMLADPHDGDGVREARRACGGGVEVIEADVDVLWMRDSGPTFVSSPKGLQGVDLHFNGWGGKQQHKRDAHVARTVLEYAKVPRVDAPLVGEGGSLEIDGHGTLLVTESSLVNDNRNPGLSRDEIESGLKHLLGSKKVIWVQGLKGHDITDCHVDAMARFAEDGDRSVVLLSRPWDGDGPNVWTRTYHQARGVLQTATDARGKGFELIDLPEPDPAELGDRGDDFLGSYANYYIANDAVFVPRFGDRKADDKAAVLIGDLHPGRKVVQLEIHTIAEGGGGIHCATQQQPKI